MASLQPEPCHHIQYCPLPHPLLRRELPHSHDSYCVPRGPQRLGDCLHLQVLTKGGCHLQQSKVLYLATPLTTPTTHCQYKYQYLCLKMFTANIGHPLEVMYMPLLDEYWVLGRSTTLRRGGGVCII